ncbi:divalent-cation tolerance protein CutA [Nonomuraea sp. NPDC050383]|uniref:divalent-cation tolerance protein CutA n=1 Tax=Nonomuraea sp. NPDC050383 TaxID=3364362 RepID=UPI0037B7856E
MQVSTTIDSMTSAAELAHTLTTTRLSAGVQIIGPIRSVYWWKGALHDTQEWQLLFKTLATLYPALQSHIRAHHPYEVPEIIATPIVAGSPEYLRWISEETRQSDASS